MQIEHELNQSALELCTGSGKTNESAAAQFRRALQIEKFQLFAKRDVIRNLSTQFRFFAPFASHFVRTRTRANRYARMWKVRNFEEQIAPLGCQRSFAIPFQHQLAHRDTVI